jgi:PIN domain nuclease of toxin-antitoxin system
VRRDTSHRRGARRCLPAGLKSRATSLRQVARHASLAQLLGAKAAALFARCERREAILYVPTVVMWECSLLARVGRINLRRTVRAFFDDLFSNPAYQPIDVTPGDVFLADELRFSRDPFDALIVATARNAGLSLVTRDGVIRKPGAVAVIWQ